MNETVKKLPLLVSMAHINFFRCRMALKRPCHLPNGDSRHTVFSEAAVGSHIFERHCCFLYNRPPARNLPPAGTGASANCVRNDQDEKCSLLAETIDYQIHVIQIERLKIAESTKKAIHKLKNPTTQSDV